ncbi:MAG: response regulator [Candidatus Omnitrophota bacterium]|nr:response regulator [Candidatus Omnitrophota bacterium]
MKKGIFRSLRSKLVAYICFLSLPVLFSIAFFLYQSVRDSGAYAQVLQQNAAIQFSAQQALRAAQAGELLLYQALALDETEDIQQLHDLYGQYRGTMTTFDIFIKALCWGTDSEGFRNADGGLTLAQWQRRSWHKKVHIQKPHLSIETLAKEGGSHYRMFARHGEDAIRALQTGFYYALQGKSEAAAKQREIALKSSDQAKQYAERINDVVESLMKFTQEATAESSQAISAVKSSRTLISMITGIILLIGIPILSWIYLTRTLVNPLVRLSDGVQRIGPGSLDEKIVIETEDEIGRLSRHFNRMIDNLKHSTVSREALMAEILERGKVEKSLRRSEEKIRQILESTAEAIYGVDTDGNCTFCNPSCLKMLGYHSAEQLLGKNMHSLTHHKRPDGTAYPEDACRSYDAFRKGESVHVEDEVMWRSDGNSLPVEYWSHPVRQGDAIVGAVVAFVDISERKSMEQRLLQAHKMEAVGRLSGGLAHDFNNQLTVIVGYCAFLLEDTSEDDPRLAEIEEIKKAADRAQNLARQVLAFSRQKALESSIFRVDHLIFDMELMLRRLINEDIELAILTEPALKSVKMGQGQMEQVIVNLAVNARDAMPTGGKLLITTESALFDEAEAQKVGLPPGEYVAVTIQDTGTGMNEEVKGHLFEPFFTTKGRGEGTGLGLATCYSIMRQNKGSITVESEVGKGAKFILYIPAAEGSVEDERSENYSGEMPAGEETVLLVEDEDAVRKLAVKILSQQGYRVLEAENGERALRLCQGASKIDLVVTDVVMPRMGGRELIDKLKAEKVRTKKKVLFMSGYADDLDLSDYSRHMHVGFLQKPFTPASLAHKVREVLDK